MPRHDGQDRLLEGLTLKQKKVALKELQHTPDRVLEKRWASWRTKQGGQEASGVRIRPEECDNG